MKDHYIAENHFPVQIAPGVFMLGNYFFNIFLILGEKKSALFEVGISGVVDAVISQLQGLDIYPDFIIASHPHSDHITGLPGLMQQYPDARIIAAGGAPDFVAHPKAGPLLIKEDAYMSKSLGNFGISPGRPSLEKVPDLRPAELVNKALSLNLGGTTLELSRVDGHSPGNLIAKLADPKIVFSSDSLGFHFPGRGFLPLFFTGAASYVSVLQDIVEFSPAIICPAHQGTLKGVQATQGLQKSLDTTLSLIKQIKASTRADNDLSQQLFGENYKDEFTLYTKENIKNCTALLVKRARQADIG